MIEFITARLLERVDFATLRIDAFENVLDRGVLAGGVHALQDQEQRPAVLCIEPFLKIGQALAVGLKDLLGFFLVEAAFLVGLVRPQVEFAVAIDPERRNKPVELEAN